MPFVQLFGQLDAAGAWLRGLFMPACLASPCGSSMLVVMVGVSGRELAIDGDPKRQRHGHDERQPWRPRTATRDSARGSTAREHQLDLGA
jgi:hypothetical protein